VYEIPAALDNLYCRGRFVASTNGMGIHEGDNQLGKSASTNLFQHGQYPVVGRCKLIRKHPKTWQLRLDHKTWESQGILARRKTTEDLHRFCWGNLAMQQ
jgi:hypothetical protein